MLPATTDPRDPAHERSSELPRSPWRTSEDTLAGVTHHRTHKTYNFGETAHRLLMFGSGSILDLKMVLTEQV